MLHPFDHQHLDGFAAGHEFEAEFAERQIHRIPILILLIAFRAIRVFFYPRLCVKNLHARFP